VLDCGTVI